VIEKTRVLRLGQREGGLKLMLRRKFGSVPAARETMPARDDILFGRSAVNVTLGPKARNSLLDNLTAAPRISKDGVAVSKEIELARADRLRTSARRC